MFEKLGSIKEGILRKSVYKNGKFNNRLVLSLLSEEFFDISK